jgi:transaldolase
LKLFVDSSDPSEVRDCFARQWVVGATTGLSAADGALAQLCAAAAGPVSVSVQSAGHEEMLHEARTLVRLAPNAVARLPLTVEGLKAARACAEDGIATHLVACESPAQAILAAKAGARWVSPVASGLPSANELIRGLAATFRTYRLDAEVLVMPVRSASQVVDVALAGAGVAAVQMPVLEQVIKSGAASPAGASK